MVYINMVDDMYYLVLLMISILPVFLVSCFVYNRDKDKEPTFLLIRLFFGGVCAFFVTIVITLLLSLFFPNLLFEQLNTDYISLFFHVFFGIALVEEFSKWLFVYHIGFNNKEFDQVFDMIVYAVFVALGFACFENILYVFENGFWTAIIRGLLSVPGHACDGVFMGYYLSMAKVCSVNGDVVSSRQNKFKSIFVPMFLHGFYDYCLFSGNILFLLLFLIFIIILYITTFKRVRSVSLVNRRIQYHDKFCPCCGYKIDSDYCPMCGRKNE